MIRAPAASGLWDACVAGPVRQVFVTVTPQPCVRHRDAAAVCCESRHWQWKRGSSNHFQFITTSRTPSLYTPQGGEGWHRYERHFLAGCSSLSLPELDMSDADSASESVV